MNLLGITIKVTADGVAWYAAIVATMSAFVAGYAVWRDRVKLVVCVAKDMIGASLDMKEQSGPFVQVTVANRGRRVIRLGSIALKERRTDHVHLIFNSATRPAVDVLDGSSHSEILEQAGLDLSNLRLVLVIDGTGREWIGRAKFGKESRLYRGKIMKWLLRLSS